ncbi:hypothetical protein GCM10023201_20620 [Actinomycetospora corticicola]|uniref:Uncharacterized protein n=1 Tax=Actinomycetospora corticicola TaxID=663602 RepID=A0A7Y9J3N2_9PSEU|nr:hypothetical protein [Actinomycetospora corticicola]NYD34222.1 hypothetical protein [Actinomycetospora corticicola]
MGERALGVADGLLGEVAAHLVERHLERRALVAEAPLQGARVQAEVLGDGADGGLPRRQEAVHELRDV